jgi:hypothetical protein
MVLCRNINNYTIFNAENQVVVRLDCLRNRLRPWASYPARDVRGGDGHVRQMGAKRRIYRPNSLFDTATPN